MQQTLRTVEEPVTEETGRISAHLKTAEQDYEEALVRMARKREVLERTQLEMDVRLGRRLTREQYDALRPRLKKLYRQRFGAPLTPAELRAGQKKQEKAETRRSMAKASRKAQQKAARARKGR